jgi:ribonuclease HI
MKTAVVYCDGGARGNPGPAAAAAVLLHPDLSPLDEASKYLGCATNNIAEYEGILLGLELAKKHGIVRLTLRLDSELVVKQVRGEYKVRHPGLKPLWEKTKNLLRGFPHWEIEHVPREQNKEADRLVNCAMDANC